MADTDNVTFNRPADRLLELIRLEHERMDGVTLNAHNLYEEACAVLRNRLDIDNFQVKGKK